MRLCRVQLLTQTGVLTYAAGYVSAFSRPFRDPGECGTDARRRIARDRVVDESLLAIRRAGADVVLTCCAPRWPSGWGGAEPACSQLLDGRAGRHDEQPDRRDNGHATR